MGNLLGCFGVPKKQKRKRPTSESAPKGKVTRQHHGQLVPLNPSVEQSLKAPVAEGAEFVLRDGNGQSSYSSPKKKVTFNLNVQTYGHAPSSDDDEDMSIAVDEEPEATAAKEEGEEDVESFAKSSGLGAYPLHHRYQNCTNSDEEDGQIDDELSEEEEEQNYCELDDDGDFNRGNEEEQSYDSYFSLQTDKDKDLMGFKEVSSGIVANPIPSSEEKPQTLEDKKQRTEDRGSSNHAQPAVLNSVENLSQWKVMTRAKETPAMHPYKENINVEEEEGSRTPSPPLPTNSREQNIIFQKPCELTPSSLTSSSAPLSVDASLSSWLTPPNTTPVKGGSRSPDERPILGALTVEDLKQSVSSSPGSRRRSPRKSPDDMPILGTVGSYWNHTNSHQEPASDSRGGSSSVKGIPNTTSKYREDKRVNWHSTPFEVRLERALNKNRSTLARP